MAKKTLTHTLYFNSLAAMADFCEAHPNATPERQNPNERDAFYGEPMDWTIETVRSGGWSEGRNLISEIALETAEASTVKVMDTMLDVGGYYPVVPLAVAGDPCCMVAPGEETHQREKTLTLIFSGAYGACFNSTEINNFGAAILSLCDALENEGRSVALYGAIACSEGPADKETAKSERVEFYTRLKETGEPLDIDALAFYCVRPETLRRLGFRCLGASPLRADTLTEQGGRPLYSRQALRKPPVENALWLGGMNDLVFDKRAIKSLKIRDHERVWETRESALEALAKMYERAQTLRARRLNKE